MIATPGPDTESRHRAPGSAILLGAAATAIGAAGTAFATGDLTAAIAASAVGVAVTLLMSFIGWTNTKASTIGAQQDALTGLLNRIGLL